MAKTLRKNRKLSLHAKQISLATVAGDYDKLTFTEKDLRNHVAKSVRVIQEKGDAQSLMHFWAGMSNTQRSESMHAFMKGYLISKSNLQQFVTQYDNCLANKAQQEYELDAASFNTIIPCATTSTIEKQFQKEYTHAKFNEL
ncbi:hypothetical protein AHAS_Ahas16G0130900 [Arachis hypogaea]